MQNLCKYGITLLLVTLTCTISFGQVLNGDNGHRNIEARFVRENLKIKPQDAFFNVLKIINNSDREKFINLRYETPVGWKLISDKEKRINLEPNDSVSLPFRASANRQVKGEVGYSIVASLTTRSGDPITSAYCFIKVPRKSRLRFRPLTRVTYIDQKKKKGSFSFRLINEGNIDEVVYLNFTSTPTVSLQGEVNNSYSTDVVVQAKSDTTLSYSVQVAGAQPKQSLYRVDLKGNSERSSFSTSFWFKNLMSSYHHDKPSNEYPLILEMNLENLFSERESYLTGTAKGNLLFTDKKALSYYFHKSPSRGRRDNFLQTSKFYLDYSTTNFEVSAGNGIPFQLRQGYGKGIALKYFGFKNINFQGKYSRNVFLPVNNYGMNINYKFSDYPANIQTKFEYSDDLKIDEQVVLGMFKSHFSVRKDHSFITEFGLTSAANKFSLKGKPGYHYRVRYKGEFDDLRINLRNRYNSSNYYGGYYGRNEINASARYNYKKGYYFNLFLRNTKQTPSFFYQDSSNIDIYRLQRDLSFRTTKRLNNTFTIFGGPEYEHFSSNSFYNYGTSKPFVTDGGFFHLGGRMNFGNYKRISTSFRGGATFANQYNTSSATEQQKKQLESRDVAFVAQFDLNYYSRNFGVFFKYNHGPYNGNQYYSYLYSGSYNQLLRLMPYYRDFIYKDIIQLDSRLNYMYSINRQTHRINWGNEIRFHLDYGFLLRLIGNFTLQSTVGESQRVRMDEKQKYTYSNTYFELRLRKNFGWNQPRIKYYDLKVNLFKDLNGNLNPEPNEPGMKNVLVNIEKVDPDEVDSLELDYESKGNLANNRLLSGMEGTVSYENMPRGLYRLKLKNVGTETGKFSADQQEMLVHLNRDRTINIPYLERNKIYGKVILNRSKLSNLGQLDKSNIKVTAEDSKGRKTSTLTDKNGEFTIYAPSVDKYDVYINNIFKEHFDLRKNHYTVQLNGYKQFEVNFIFDEKRRQINFSPSISESDVEVKSVKRTNLTGTVKDENTLQPVRATLEVVDNKTGSTIETTRSDPETGRFSMSFMTGSNYSLIVSAQGYWLYTEKLDLDQMLTIQDVEKEVLLKNIMIGSRLDLENLQFEPGSSEIPNDAYPEIDRLIEQLKDNPNVRIQIAGHADALEQLDHPDISEERAKEVAKYIMQNGFSNIEYVGYKDKKPVAPNDSEQNRARNRRVEITVVDK